MIHKAFVILEALSPRKTNTISNISARTNIPNSTVHRILQALAKEGVVVLKPKKGYVMTPKLVSIGLQGIEQRELLDVAIPIMRSISEKTMETVSLNVISGYERICIYRVEGDHPITRNIRIGDRAPLFIGSAGKVIASGLNQVETDEFIKKYVEDGSIKEDQVESILNEIHKVKEQGFAISVSERIQNSASIAVPITDITGYILASLSVSTIADRISENKHKYLELLLEASKQISASQGNLL
jgi:IclR family KDG regulon transcriptional repressor